MIQTWHTNECEASSVCTLAVTPHFSNAIHFFYNFVNIIHLNKGETEFHDWKIESFDKNTLMEDECRINV